MKVELTRTLTVPLAKRVDLSRALMREIGDWAVTTIARRTRAGRDIDGRAFQPLSPEYAKAKSKALGNDRADLTVSGRMLNDLKPTVTSDTEVELRFLSQGGRASGGTFIQRSRAVGAADKAYWHHVSGAGRSRVKRPFLGLSAHEEAKVRDMVAAYLKRKAQG